MSRILCCLEKIAIIFLINIRRVSNVFITMFFFEFKFLNIDLMQQGKINE
jgi:hypothetical protein